VLVASFIPFLLVFVAVVFYLDQAILGLTLGPEAMWPLILCCPFTFPLWHDMGIALASVGLALIFLPVTISLPWRRGPVEQWLQRRFTRIALLVRQSDLFYILAFFGFFTACLGIWFCMHQAFLYQSEYAKGTLESPMYVFLGLEVEPLFLHTVGRVLVAVGLGILAVVVAIKRCFE